MLVSLLFTQSQDASPALDYRLQDVCMRRMFGRVDESPASACTWPGVKCADGIIRNLNIGSPDSRSQHLQIAQNRVPNSVRFLTLQNLALCSASEPRCLPQDLKYLYMENICMSEFARFPDFVDLGHLPIDMEELHMTDVRVWTTVCISSLPSGMRIMQIASYDIRRILVNKDGLPASLRRAHLHAGTYKKPGSVIFFPDPAKAKKFWVVRPQKAFGIGEIFTSDSRFYGRESVREFYGII